MKWLNQASFQFVSSRPPHRAAQGSGDEELLYMIRMFSYSWQQGGAVPVHSIPQKLKEELPHLC